tara:strand:+ start:779 stop:1012 length:234 start_codon:yes stop_codon:yes gene_type:complete
LGVGGIKFENAAYGSRPQMVTVYKFSAQVVLLPVFTKKVEVNHVLLSGADILIENAKLSYIDVAISLNGGNLHVSPL